MIISRYHLPTRGTPEIVQILASDLLNVLGEPLTALRRCLPQIRGVLPIQDAEAAIATLERTLAELRGVIADPQETE